MQAPRMRKIALCIATLLGTGLATTASAGIPAAHVYHNHMPNFWPFYGVDATATYNATAVGQPVRYFYDGQVINLKSSPPAGYSYFLPTALGGAIMPHDDLVTYYTPDAKVNCYQGSSPWAASVASGLQSFAGGSGQIHVTMSGALVNNVNSLETLQNVPGYSMTNWGTPWTNAYNSLKTTSGNHTLDLVHFTGHHSMGPLVGPDYFLKDLIFHGATLSQSYFLGSSYQSSKGFFPTELGFSERLIPTLAKLGITWSVMGNNHFSRTLQDYPYAKYDPAGDTLISPPNRADLRNVSTVGDWNGSSGMAHEQQFIVNKFPFASTPHYVRYVDPATGAVSQIAGIPVDQNGSWLEGWDGSTSVDELTPYSAAEPRQFFVVAHDGDNSSGRAGSLDTWYNGYNATCTGNGYCLGIDEYLKKFPIPTSDVQHIQDGSWVDTRDSSSDPTWYHWHLPYMIWKGQFADFNKATGLTLAPKVNLNNVQEGGTVSFEYGWHYLERNFAVLQAGLNYAKTAEQIWLDAHPNYWSPSTNADKQVTYSGNQLNPWMLSYPVKGDAANDYKGGANPAELGWYFLLPAMDSGFGYYDENKDDDVKPTLAVNNSLAFTKPYVTANLASDKTGPSVWWPQRYPYNPGSVNASKAEGWTVQHYSKDFAIYTYAYDVSGIASINVKIRTHASNTINNADDTYKVYDPAALAGTSGLSITPSSVSAWKSYPMNVRALKPSMNGVDWVPNTKATMQVLPAQDTGDLYYAYISDYRNQLLDYYVEATDTKGNVTRSDIQQVFVGAGTYTKSSAVGSGYVEDINGTVQGVFPFLIVDTQAPSVPGAPSAGTVTDASVSLTWAASTDNVGVTGYKIYRNGTLVGTSATASYTDTGLTAKTTYSYTVAAYDAANNLSAQGAAGSVTTKDPDTIPPTAPTTPVASNVTASSATLSWTAATDNYGVASYDVYRDGVKVGSSTTTSYTDTTLQPSTTYTYTFYAFDAAGNKSPVSVSLPVTTAAGNIATVYYKVPSGWSAVDIHYQPTGGSWTTAPGVAMTAACTGWDVYTVNLSAANGLTAAFNNGSGTWDNNSGKNYTLGTGISAVSSGVVTTTNPCVDTQAPTVPAGLASSNVAQTSATITWTASTDNIGVTGYNVYRDGKLIGSSATTSYNDSGLTANTSYSYTVSALDAAKNESAQSTALPVKTLFIDTVAPSVPAGLAASNVTQTTATISWTASTDNVGVVGYNVYRDGKRICAVPVTSFSDGGLTANTGYSYTITAVDAAGNESTPSTALAVKTAPPDTLAPTVPAGLASSNVTASNVTLSWTASTDNVAVTGYTVYRDGKSIGTSATTSYSDTTVVAGTTYNYTVAAFDAVPNTSAQSTALPVSTPAGNSAKVYYKVPSGWSTVNIHYGIGGTWTTSPGVAMKAACTGWDVYTVNLGTATALAATFNNGSGTWDNNGSKNYALGTGISAVANGVVTTADPCNDTQAPTVPTALVSSNVTSTSVTVSWTASTDNIGVAGYTVLRDGVKIGTATTTSYTDTTVVAGKTYAYTVQAYDAVPNTSAASTALNVAVPTDTCTSVNVTFTIANAATVVGQNLYVVGNQTKLGNWTPASGYALAIVGSGANVPWSGTVALPPATSVQYKYVKWNGSTAVWESNQTTTSGNRVITTPACGGTLNQNDGSFKK